MKASSLLLIAVLTLLAGCTAHAPKPAEVITVKVPVTVPCIDKKPEPPKYRFGVGDRPAEQDMAAILATDFEAADEYGRAWEAAAAGCGVANSNP